MGEADNGREAVELVARPRPGIVVMDIGMRELNGIDVTARRRRGPAVRVLILSMHATEDFVRRALRAGAAGYLVKDAVARELSPSSAVARGETYLSPRVSGARGGGTGAGPAAGGRSRLDALTPRQREILQLIAEGRTTQGDRAARSSLSVKTVETHRAALMERLDIHDVAGLTRYAIRIGLISGER